MWTIFVWLFGISLIALIVGIPSLKYRDLESLIEIGMPSAIIWSVIWWSLILFDIITGALY